MLTLHSREYRFLFSYLLLATGLLAGLAGWLLYRNYKVQVHSAVYLSDRLERSQHVFEEQQQYLPKLDSAYQAVVAYRPEVTAVFLEADIENQLSELRRLYVRRTYTTNAADDTTHFFHAFDQMANFYLMLYRDKKILASKQANIGLLAEQLNTCQLDYHSKAPAGTIAPTAPPPPTAPLTAPSPPIPR